jgi:N-acetylgalactosamine-N,N'-diacetylbacillosaminyl-diphospho-undecaprenol 4-alpha-N-acetylgalactosaminyltransferase
MSSAGLNNILLISPESGFGGSEKSFATLSKMLKKHYNVHIVFFSNYIIPTYPLYGNIIYLDTPGAKNILQSIINIIRRFNQIRKIKKKLDVVASISFLEGANYLNVLTKRKEKCIISIRGSIIHDPNIKGIGRILRKGFLIPLFYKKADRVICISKGLKDEMVNFFNLKKNKIKIIYNSINPIEIENQSTEMLDAQYEDLFNDYTLISHSRISYEKGIQYQFLILNKLIKKIPDLKLILIGEGPYMDDLIKICDRLKLKYFVRGKSKWDPAKVHVIFWGYSENPYKLIRKADMFVSTSLTEGFGNSILEAMACKCVVISSNCPYGPEEIIIPDNDLLKNNAKEYPICHENGILLPVIKHSKDKKALDLWISTIEDIIHKRITSFSIDSAYQRACYFNEKKLKKNWIDVINENRQ